MASEREKAQVITIVGKLFDESEQAQHITIVGKLFEIRNDAEAEEVRKAMERIITLMEETE